MSSILNVEVSCFKNYKTTDNPKPVNILQWLCSAKYAKAVKQIRGTSDKNKRDQLKANLPAITPSGQFSYRSKKDLIKHSGFIQFDIDGKDHTNIANFGALKTEISKIVNVAYVGLSVSGRGYWGLIPIKYPEKHMQHFKAMKKAFGALGMRLDDKPSHVASLRGYSYDPDGFYNHHAKPFELLYEPKLGSTQTRKMRTYRFQTGSQNPVEKLIEKIQSGSIDITDGYDNWLRIGFAFSEEFGEAGREYFHAVSRFHPDYHPRKTDRQFSHCLRSGGNGITIATFYHQCKVHGITLKNRIGLRPAKKDKPLDVKFESGKKTLNRFHTKKAKIEAEYKQALKKDPILREIDNIFEPEIIT